MAMVEEQDGNCSRNSRLLRRDEALGDPSTMEPARSHATPFHPSLGSTIVLQAAELSSNILVLLHMNRSFAAGCRPHLNDSRLPDVMHSQMTLILSDGRL